MAQTRATGSFSFHRLPKNTKPYIRYSDDGGKTFTAAQPGIRRLSSWECEKYGIRPIEYVDNSEFAYTKTGILGSDDAVMELVTSVTDLIQNYSMMAGCRTFRPTKELYIGTYKTGGTVYAVGAFGNIVSKTFAIKEDAVFSYRLSSEGFCVDGKKVGGTPAYVPGSVPVNEIAVASWNDNGTFSNRIRQKIYHARVKSESQGKETELFPAVNSEGVTGLFDRVERKFHVSDQKGKRYVKGGDVPPDDTFGTTPGEWMGVAFSDKGYPPFDVNEYTWSRTKGDPGKGVKSVVRYFGLSDSPAREPKSWSPVPATPTDEMPYLWAFDRITYTDGTSVDTTHAVAGAKGSQAEFHRLRTVAETASVGTDNVLTVMLSYEIEHVRGAQVTAVAGDRKGIHVTARTSTGAEISMTAGARNEGHYEMQNYSKQANRPDYVVVELKDVADRTLDSRTVQVTMEAASFVNVIGDVRETVSQHGRNISRIEQKADGISLKVEGMKNGVRNLLKGGRLNVSFSTYGLPSAFRLKLKPDTDYTLTVCGRISEDALKKGQTLRTYVFDKDWKWSADFGIQSTSDTAASVTFRIPADRHSPEDYLISSFPFPNQEPKGKNGEVTVSWIVLTEGTQAAASWIPAEGETGEEKAAEVEARLENGEFRVKSDRTVFVDGNGKETVLIKDGKLSAELIDAVKLVAAGIRAQTIDAQNAVFRNITVEGDSRFKGRLDGASGTFKSLDCLDENGETVGGIGFSQDGRMYFSGHVAMNGTKEVNGRQVPFRFYTADVWCRGQFGNRARTFAVIKDEFMYVHHGGHEDTDGVKIRMDTTTYITGGYPQQTVTVYVIPLYSPGYKGAFGRWHGTVVDIDNPNVSGAGDPSRPHEIAADLEVPYGCPIDVVIFNCTKDAHYTFYDMLDGKTWTVINGNKDRNIHVMDRGGTWDMPGGVTADYTYVSPKWLTPRYEDDGNRPWLGVMHSGFTQINL